MSDRFGSFLSENKKEHRVYFRFRIMGPYICSGKRFPFLGLKGNAVKIGDSSRCCEPRPHPDAVSAFKKRHWRSTKEHREGFESGESQKTCLCIRILQPAENGPDKSIWRRYSKHHLLQSPPGPISLAVRSAKTRQAWITKLFYRSEKPPWKIRGSLFMLVRVVLPGTANINEHKQAIEK